MFRIIIAHNRSMFRRGLQFCRPQSVLLGLLMLVVLTSCGIGGSGNTEGNTQVASGSIIGFGSIIVNGIEYTRKPGLADNRVKLRFENNTSASEGDLRVGMIVTIRGAVNTSAGTGEYESIEFQPEVRGPLDSDGVDLANKQLTVMGNPVQIEANTSFETCRDLAELNDDLLHGDNPELEISGILDDDGLLHATRIGYKASDFFSLSDKVVLTKGKIAHADIANGASSGSFTIGSLNVNFSADSLGADTVVGDLVPGALLEVKGALDGNVITASRVEKKRSVNAAVNETVRIKGIATSDISNNSLTINGPSGAITVNTVGVSFLRAGTAATSAIVTDGASLEVEGTLQADGTIAAASISVGMEKSFRLEGNAAAGIFDAAANTLTLNGAVVDIVVATRLLDDDGSPMDPGSIAAGDHIRIDGVYAATSGRLSASQVQRTEASNNTFVRGPVTAVANPVLTLMGTITVNTSDVQPQKFVDNRNGVISNFAGRTDYFNALTIDGMTFVNAKGSMTGATMNATEVSLK